MGKLTKGKVLLGVLLTALMVCALVVPAAMPTPVLADDVIVWEYSTGGGFCPLDAARLESGNTLITQAGNDCVREVTPAGNIVWKHCAYLDSPSDAERLANGNTLITDSGNNRVIEVTSAGVIDWEYKVGLDYPMDAERLANDNTLITDCSNNRVIEVTSAGLIAWEYNAGSSCLMDAERLANDNTLITDWQSKRVIEVNSAGSIVWEYSTGLVGPADAERLADGNTLITDMDGNRVIEIDSAGVIVWEYSTGLNLPADAERLEGGNTLITDMAVDRVIEVGAPAVLVDLRTTGVAGDLFDVIGYSVPGGTITEDGITVDTQTAMGALICYCQENTINIEVTEGGWGPYVVQIGDSTADENCWMYAVNEVTPGVGADQYPLVSDDSVHWFNYTLGYYQLLMAVDKTSIIPGEDITFSVTWTDGNGTTTDVENAEVLVSAILYDPGVSQGFTNSGGDLTVTWNDEGTYYPYAEIDTRSSMYQWPTPEFTCAGAYPNWDVNEDGDIDTQDIVLVGMHWGESGAQGWIREDVNNDGDIDTQDIVIIGMHWGE